MIIGVLSKKRKKQNGRTNEIVCYEAHKVKDKCQTISYEDIGFWIISKIRQVNKGLSKGISYQILIIRPTIMHIGVMVV